ncbi:alpha/beta fold hydrolase [Actinophytocola sp.]|uniref:alpha/beta fold hydrolase n=1 Tax=Actinophytocola sp. TaxID=1872138 RepID=UPI003899AFAD
MCTFPGRTAPHHTGRRAPRGPGIADLPGLSRFFQPLAALGYDVYVYDELGASRSARSENPRAYGIECDVADLEEVRHTIGAERMILIGHSYGGTLAAHYLAAYPIRVTRLVLSSPGPLDPADTSENAATSRLLLYRRLAAARVAHLCAAAREPGCRTRVLPGRRSPQRHDSAPRRRGPALHPGAIGSR